MHKLKLLFNHLGLDLSKKFFQVCLCNNGVEFSRFYEIEIYSKGDKILQTFFTNSPDILSLKGTTQIF